MMLEDHTALLLLRNQCRYSSRGGDTGVCWGAGIDGGGGRQRGPNHCQDVPWMMVTLGGGH